VTVVLIGRDLLLGSRIAAAAAMVEHEFLQVDDPTGLPSPASVKLVLVDWAERLPDWGERFEAWTAGVSESARPRLLLFGPHTDLVAHADARSAGLGPMWARSKLVATLPALLARVG
jgi:hypothetical protein